MLKGKSVLLGITGGIAAYKSAYLASALVKQHCHVQVIMTENATQFISPLTFEQLTGNKAQLKISEKVCTDRCKTGGIYKIVKSGSATVCSPSYI